MTKYEICGFCSFFHAQLDKKGEMEQWCSRWDCLRDEYDAICDVRWFVPDYSSQMSSDAITHYEKMLREKMLIKALWDAKTIYCGTPLSEMTYTHMWNELNFGSSEWPPSPLISSIPIEPPQWIIDVKDRHAADAAAHTVFEKPKPKPTMKDSNYHKKWYKRKKKK